MEKGIFITVFYNSIHIACFDGIVKGILYIGGAVFGFGFTVFQLSVIPFFGK